MILREIGGNALFSTDLSLVFCRTQTPEVGSERAILWGKI